MNDIPSTQIELEVISIDKTMDHLNGFVGFVIIPINCIKKKYFFFNVCNQHISQNNFG